MYLRRPWSEDITQSHRTRQSNASALSDGFAVPPPHLLPSLLQLVLVCSFLLRSTLSFATILILNAPAMTHFSAIYMAPTHHPGLTGHKKVSSVPWSKIPRVSKLSEELGFRLYTRKKTPLYLAVVQWRNTYVTRDGVPGYDLLNWKSTETNDELKIMTLRFLDDHGKELWPKEGNACIAEPGASTSGATHVFQRLTYPRDHDQLVTVLS